MSYSRWSTSYWYTYWADGGDEDTYDTAKFCICRFMEPDIIFTAQELRNSFDNCVNKVKEIDPEADELDIEELKVYFHRFLRDVTDEYGG